MHKYTWTEPKGTIEVTTYNYPKQHNLHQNSKTNTTKAHSETSQNPLPQPTKAKTRSTNSIHKTKTELTPYHQNKKEHQNLICLIFSETVFYCLKFVCPLNTSQSICPMSRSICFLKLCPLNIEQNTSLLLGNETNHLQRCLCS